MSRYVRCSRCGAQMPLSEFYVSVSTRRRDRECKLCKHHRLAAHHARQAELIRARRQNERAAYSARVEQARAALGRD